MIKDIEHKSREMLWRIFSPMRIDPPEQVCLFEWYPGIHFCAELTKTDDGAGRLIVRKIDKRRPKESNVVWEEDGVMHFSCFQPRELAIGSADAFSRDVFFLTAAIRNMIEKHEGEQTR